MEGCHWIQELSIFAKDLFADLISRHPLLYMLPYELGGSRYFKEVIGKCVMFRWHEIRKEMSRKLRNDFPGFAKSEDSFKRYLQFFVDIVVRTGTSAVMQVFELSAVLLEVLCFVHRRGFTNFVPDASSYLFYMLLSVKRDEFCEEGGWKLLSSMAVELTKNYDEVEICRQYLLENVCNFGTSTSGEISGSKDFSRTSRNVILNVSQQIWPITLDKERDSNVHKVSTESKALNPHEDPNCSRKKPVTAFHTESRVADTKNVTVELGKSNGSLEDPGFKPSQPEVAHVISEFIDSEEIILKNSYSRTPLQLSTSQTSESTKDLQEKPVERKSPDRGEQAAHKPTTECPKEQDTCILKSPVGKESYKTDVCMKSLDYSTEKKDSDIHDFNRSGIIQFNESKEKGCEITVNPRNPQQTENFQISSKHEDKPITQKYLKSPKPDTSKKYTPRKDLKSPSLKKSEVGYVKNKALTPKSEIATPKDKPKVVTTKPTSLAASKAMNKTENKEAPKTLKTDSGVMKHRVATDPKTQTNREHHKIQSKSSEKSDRSRRVSLTKASPQNSKTPISSLVSAVNTKSCTKDLSATESSKILPASVVRPKLEGDRSNISKSPSSAASASAVKHKVGAKDSSQVSEKVKLLKSFNLEAESAKHCGASEKSVDSSSSKSTVSTDNKSSKSSKDYLDSEFSVGGTSRTAGRHGLTKGSKSGLTSSSLKSVNPVNPTERTRNMPGKSSDSKQEKPRWR